MYDKDYILPVELEINNHPIEDASVLSALYGRITVLRLCELVGIQIPRFCFHRALPIAGNCRMCMIELRGTEKPLIACATTLERLQAIYTNSTLVRMARESVLEFLLINHPLDCPICDQGGECDLQDISFTHGSDRGRFKEEKRSVTDIIIHPFVKTIMTRCIHCTRCIRYLDNVAGVPSLGTMGRGGSTEVGTYLNILINSEVIVNVVDLCPVGALTSKPYAFLARPWELDHIESIDILDSLCSRIRIDTRGNTILRILPRYSSRANQAWISDRARFFFESVLCQRIINPLVNLNRETDSAARNMKHPFYRCSWEMAFSYLASVIQSCVWNHKLLLTFSGTSADLHSTLSFLSTFRSMGISENSISMCSNAETDLRYDYIIPVQDYSWLRDWMISHYYIYVGFNPRHDSPVLNLRLRAFHLKQSSQHRVFIIGEAYYTTARGLQIATFDSSLRDFGRGLSTYSLPCAAEDPIFLVGPSLAMSGGAYNHKRLLEFVLFTSLIHLIIHNVVPYAGDMSVFEWGCPVDLRLSAGIRINASGYDVSKSCNSIGLLFLQENDSLAALRFTKRLNELPKHLLVPTIDGRKIEPVLASSKLPIFSFSEWKALLFELRDPIPKEGLLFLDHVTLVYHGANVGFAAREAHLIFPSLTYAEHMAYYVTCGGDVRFTTTAVAFTTNVPENPLLLTLLRLSICEFFPLLSQISHIGSCKFLRSPYVIFDKYYQMISVINDEEDTMPLTVLDPTSEQYAYYRRLREAYGLDDHSKYLECAARNQFDPRYPGFSQYEIDWLMLHMYSGSQSRCKTMCDAFEYETLMEMFWEDVREARKSGRSNGNSSSSAENKD